MSAVLKEQAPVEHFDAHILGSGEAGKYLSWHLASSLNCVALVERRYIGGSWPNIACLPSKDVIHSANITHNTRKAAASGFFPSDVAHVDMAVVRQGIRDMVQGLVEMHRTASGRRDIITSTGSSPRLDDDMPGLLEANPLTHVEILEVKEVPSHRVILRGGYSGLEFAQAMRRLGSEVSVVERGSHMFKHEDDDISSALSEIFINEGIEFHTSAAVQHMGGRSGTSVTVITTVLRQVGHLMVGGAEPGP
ncbi:MAG: hypothetical protein Q9217_005202 [Psora testacea]